MTELDWLTERRPEVAPDEEATARARRALVAHAAGERRDGEAAPWRAGHAGPRRGGGEAAPWRAGDAAGPRRAPRRGARRRPADLWPRSKAGLYTLAAAVFAVAIVIAAGALPSGEGPRLAAPEPAAAASLVRLSERIQAEPEPRGDATLVLRRHAFPHGRSFTGADLYLDDGRYFFAETRAGLRDAAPQEEFGQRQIAAANAAVDLPPARARERMIAATWGPDGEPAEQAPPAEKRPPGNGPTPTPAPQIVIDNNRVWMGSMDALIAGAGRADVRAGVMRLLATIPKVTVGQGDRVLTVRNADFPDGYVETLVVDDRTGILRTMIGGDAGKPPSVVVEYEITRVAARELLR